ncbi:MAG: PD-(D/E)XK nuclease family protein, partial [Caldimicrobium sp.]
MMTPKTYLIPPSSHFLKTLTNFALDTLSLTSQEISNYYIIFPTKRACYFFKEYLRIKAPIKSFFIPKILSWDDFLTTLYLEFTEEPKILFPESARVLLFLEVLKPSTSEEDPKTVLFWGQRFLEVFEEFESEGKNPKNLIYPPESLPDKAKDFLESLAQKYEQFKTLLDEKKALFNSLILSEVKGRLVEMSNFIPTFIKGLIFAGFAALKNVEKEIFTQFIQVSQANNLPMYIFFADKSPPHPIIQETLKALNLEAQLIPDEYLEIKAPQKEIKLYSFPDLESEAYKAIELIKPSVKNFDQIALILPQNLSLLPLYEQLEKLENLEEEFQINITLPYPAKFLPFCQFLLLLLKAQKESSLQGTYPAEIIRKIFNFPLLRGLFKEVPLFPRLVETLNKLLLEWKYLHVNLEDLASHLETPYKELFEKLKKLFFTNFEVIERPLDVKSALSSLLELIKKPLSTTYTLEEFLLQEYIAYIEKEIFPLLEEDTLWDTLPIKDKKSFYLAFLEIQLISSELPLRGEPLAGLQILGFLEARLLYFDKIILFDVNEGSLPPSFSINPLLTDEMKRYLGLPLYKNDLWDYYFESILNSAKEINLFYISTAKGKGDFVKEPSRYILKLKWLFEKEKKELSEEIFKIPLSIKTLREELPKSKEDLESIEYYLTHVKELSRNFFETYLSCPVKFYFKYLLGLKEKEDYTLKDKDIGTFLHKFFERLFEDYKGKSFSYIELYEKGNWREIFSELLKEENFEKRLDPLSFELTRTVGVSCLEKYFENLKNREENDTIKETVILGIEEKLTYESIYQSNSIIFTGKADFIVERKENNKIKYIIFDFKSNPHKKPMPKKLEALMRAPLPSTLDKEGLISVRDLFGQDLTNFQLLFYLFLFLKNSEKFLDKRDYYSLDAGFLTPTHLKDPEKLLLKNLKPAKITQVIKYLEKDFEGLLHWILTHILESPSFYFLDENETCNFCPYR